MGFFAPNIKKLQSQRDVEGLIKALEDPREDIRIAAAKALGEIGGPRALAALVHCLGEWLDEHKSYKVSDNLALSAREATRITGDIDGLLKLLDTGAPEDRCGAAFALGALGNQRAVETLISVLGDTQEDPWLRVVASNSLGALGDQRAVESLISALAEPGDIGAASANALGRIGDPQGVRPVVNYFIDRVRSFDMQGITPHRVLVDMLIDKRDGPFRSEAEGIAAFGSAAVGPLREALDQERDEKVRLAIENVLRRAEAQAPRTSVTLWAEDEHTARRLITDGEFLIPALRREGTDNDKAQAFLAAVAEAPVGAKISGTIQPNLTRGGFDVTLHIRLNDD